MDPFYLALVLFCIAIVLAFVDLFVPSGGMLLLLSAIAALACILFGFRSGNSMGMAMLTLVAASIPTFVYTAIKIWPHTPIGRRIILGPPESKAAGQSEPDLLNSMIGSVLHAEYSLMPSGQISIGHRRFNAVAESGLIEAGQNVEVIGVKERNLVVRATQAPLSMRDDERRSPPSPPEMAPESLLDVPAEQFGLDSIDGS